MASKKYVGAEVDSAVYKDFKEVAESNGRSLAAELRMVVRQHAQKAKRQTKGV